MSKRQRLIARAAATARRPQPDRLSPSGGRHGYRVVSVSLFTDQANWLDFLTTQLQKAGYPKANRSFVAQEAITFLANHLQATGVTAPADLAAFFSGHAAARRAGS